MRRILLTILLLTFGLTSAQELTKGRHNATAIKDTLKQKKLRHIVESYDQGILLAMYNEYHERYTKAKQEAEAYAIANNLPLRINNPDGTFDELQRIAPDGTLLYYSLHNVDAAISTRANFLNTGGGLGLNLNGDNLIAHVWDGGPSRPTHQEFDGLGGTNRVSINDGVTSLNGNSFHAQHVTGTIVASGQNPAAKGMAWQGDCYTYDWNSDLSEATSSASGGMLLSNHSYGYNATAIPDSWFGQYGSDARDWDALMYSAQYYLQVKSAGNDGQNNTANALPLDGQSSYDKLNGDACAKNNLVIGNGYDANIDVNGNLVSMTRNPGSSEGPTDDYRIKPDLMGNGTQLTSSYDSSDTAYGTISGTSMAAPNVTGTLLLLQEHYNNINSVFMRAATLKGLALHTADDVASSGPDAETGWGLLNAKKAAETISDAPNSAVISELNLSNGGTYQVTIQADGVNPLLASISWTDPAGSVNSGTNSNTPALVNDLDLRLDNGSSFTPWRLTGVTTNGNGDNDVDPFERVDITSASGQYVLTVTHKGSLSGGSQNFSLIVTGGTIAASNPEISYGTITTTTTEGTDCSFTDVTVPLNIPVGPSQDAEVTFTVNGGTAIEGVDYEIQTPTLTFLQGQTTSQDLVVRFYNDGYLESAETAVIDFTVNANGGDATANPSADSLTITVNDDDAAPSASTDVTLLTEDFEDWTGWLIDDRDGDGNNWISLSFTSGGYTGFDGDFASSETNLSILGGTGTANADNYLISPQVTIPSNTTNTAFNFSVAGFNSVEYYRLQWTTDISSYATIDAGVILEERTSLTGDGEIRTVNRTDLAGQTGYFIVRHFNSSSNDGILLFDNLEIVATTETPVQTAVNSGVTNATIDVPGGPGTLYTFDSGNGYVMTAITNNNTDDYGCVNVSVSRAGTSGQAWDDGSSPNFVMDKTFLISSDTPPANGSTDITFYFSEAEVSGWESATGFSRDMMVVARGNATSITEFSTISIGSFGPNVTFTAKFSGLDGSFYFGTMGAFGGCTGTTKTWDGSSWSPAGAPTITDTVILNGNYDTATYGDIEACTVLINSSNTLVVNPGGLLNADGTILIDGTLTVQHTGTVVQSDPDAFATRNPDTGAVSVEITTPPLKKRDFMVMGSPMNEETRNGVFNSAFLVLQHVPANFIPHPGVPAGGTNFADDNNDFWSQLAGGSINVGEGYIVRPQAGYNDPIYTFPGETHTFDMTYNQGTINTGNIVRPVVYNGGSNPDGTPNVYANPYPSPISANMLINDVDNGLINEIYFWEHLTSPSPSIPGANAWNFSMDDISMHNGTMGLPAANDPGTTTTPNGVISTGQGFGIKAFGAGTVTFKNSMRLTSGNNTLRSPQAQEAETLTLKVYNAAHEVGSYTGVAFNASATDGWDAGFDSNRLATFVSLYSHLPDGSEQMGIQTREAFDSSIKVPMGFASQLDETTTYKISIVSREGDNLNGTSIYLVDNFTSEIFDLSKGEYQFQSDKGQFNGRFTLQFENRILNSSDQALNAVAIYPNPTDDILNIVSPVAPISRLDIYDVQGRKISEQEINVETSYQMDMSNLDTGIYFVTISTDKGKITKRVIKE